MFVLQLFSTCIPNYLPTIKDFYINKVKRNLKNFKKILGISMICIMFVEDCYLKGDLSTGCAANFIMAIGVLESLGFYINRDKSEIM